MTNYTNDLLDACLNNKLSRAQLAIYKNAEVTETIMCTAAANTNLSFFRYLVENGGNITDNAYAVTSWALKFGNWDIVKYIAQANIKVTEELYEVSIANTNFIA